MPYFTAAKKLALQKLMKSSQYKHSVNMIWDELQAALIDNAAASGVAASTVAAPASVTSVDPALSSSCVGAIGSATTSSIYAVASTVQAALNAQETFNAAARADLVALQSKLADLITKLKSANLVKSA